MDYIAVAPIIQEQICSFEVLDFTHISDHKPVSCTFNINHLYTTGDALLESLNICPRRYIWEDKGHMTHKYFLLEQNNQSFKEKAKALSAQQCQTVDDVNELNENIKELYRHVADKVIPRKDVRGRVKTQNKKMKKTTHRMGPKNPWFDDDCINLKRSVRKLAKAYGNSPLDPKIKERYYKELRKFNQLKNQRKSKWLADLSRDIGNGKI